MKNYVVYMSALTMFLSISFSCGRKETTLFVGKFTKPGDKGLSIYKMNGSTGNLSLISEWDAGPSPSYFCISRQHNLIYAINEVSEFLDSPGGGLTTLKYNDETGIIEKIKNITVPNGGPCYISLSPDGKYLLIANYGGGSVVIVKLDGNGIPAGISDFISYNKGDEKVSHPHMISFDPAGKNVYVTDLGLDRVMIYNFDNLSGQLKPAENAFVKLPEGSGPRHFVFSRDGSFMYFINELNSTISVFKVDEKEGLKPLQNIPTLKEGFNGKSYCADIHIGSSGEFLYGSNRGENSIVTFKIQNDGTLILAGNVSCGGDWPRNFVIDPSGKYLLAGNERSGNISVLTIDRKTGIPVGPGKDIKTAAPACLKFPD
jgi:6-phosphogluconolactonase